MLRRLTHYIALALILAALAAAGLVAGSYFRVSTAPAWESFAATDGSWSCIFPVQPIMRVGPAPAPLEGEQKTWSSVTDSASYELASFEPMPAGTQNVSATDGPQKALDVMAYAAVAANALEGQLEPETKGYFRIRRPGAAAIRGRVIRVSDGRVYRLLAAVHAEGGEAERASSLFLDSFRAR